MDVDCKNQQPHLLDVARADVTHVNSLLLPLP